MSSTDEKYFQIQFGPVEYCVNWEVSGYNVTTIIITFVYTYTHSA